MPGLCGHIGEHDVAGLGCAQFAAVCAHGHQLAGGQRVEAGPALREAVTRGVAVHDLGQAQALGGPLRGFQGQLGQAQQGQGLADGVVGHVGRGRVFVLAAFQRDAVAALAAHVLGGAHAVARVFVHGAWRLATSLAPRHAVGIGLHPAFDNAVGAHVGGQPRFGCSVGKGFQRAAVVSRATHHEGPTRAAEAVQVQQHIVLGQPLAQHAGDAVFEVLRSGGGLQAAVEVAIAHAPQVVVGQGVAHRHEGDHAARDFDLAVVDLVQHAAYALCARGFIPVHRTGDDEPGAGRQAGDAVGTQVLVGNHSSPPHSMRWARA